MNSQSPPATGHTPGADDPQALKQALRELIVLECDQDIDPSEINDTDQLIEGPLGLDSLDALQISVAVQEKYGLRIEGGPKARQTLASVDALAAAILAQ